MTPITDSKIRKLARKQDLTASCKTVVAYTNGAKERRWWFGDYSNFLQSPEQGLDDLEAIEFLEQDETIKHKKEIDNMKDLEVRNNDNQKMKFVPNGVFEAIDITFYLWDENRNYNRLNHRQDFLDAVRKGQIPHAVVDQTAIVGFEKSTYFDSEGDYLPLRVKLPKYETHEDSPVPNEMYLWERITDVLYDEFGYPVGYYEDIVAPLDEYTRMRFEKERSEGFLKDIPRRTNPLYDNPWMEE